MRQSSIVICILAALVVCTVVMTAQLRERKGSGNERLPSQKQLIAVQALFQKIETNLIAGSIQSLMPDFHSVVSLTLHSKEKGIYSSHQTAAILSAYLKEHRVVSFAFTTVHARSSSPYATGRMITAMKGNRLNVQVYISLSFQKGRWMISQFFIY